MSGNKHNSALFFAVKASLLLILAASSLLAQSDPNHGTQGAKQSGGQESQPAPELKQGPPSEHELHGGGADSYSLKLQSGQYVRIVAEQRGIDVVVSLFSPRSDLLVEVDSLNGRFGPEPLSWVATADGDYLVKVSSLNQLAKPGTYSIRIADLRQSVADDQIRLAGQKALAQGADLIFHQGTADALQQSIPAFRLAYAQWNQVSDSERKVASLAYLVEAYDELIGGESTEQASTTNVVWGEELMFLKNQAGGGDASAQDALGDVYFDGLGVPQDHQEALQWKLKAAEQNREDAQSAVGFIYYNFSGVVKNYTEALRWFHEAADNGFVPAQVKLGDMYVTGQGVSQDLEQARHWYQMAADAGNKVAADRLNALNKDN